MKAFRLIPVLLAALVLFSGCDFFRSLVGKPTSEDLERMRQEAVEQERQRRQDSIDKTRAIALAQAEAEAAKQDQLAGTGRYHVILGSFKVEDNAGKMDAMLKNNGYTPRVIKFNNGFSAVSAASYDNYRDALKAMYDIMEFEYCPEDVWIYDLNQKMHSN